MSVCAKNDEMPMWHKVLTVVAAIGGLAGFVTLFTVIYQIGELKGEITTELQDLGRRMLTLELTAAKTTNDIGDLGRNVSSIDGRLAGIGVKLEHK